MDKQTEQQLKACLTKKLEEQYRRGVAVGFKTACKAVTDTLNDSSKNLMARIGAVKKFCATPFRMADSAKKTDDAEVVENDEVIVEEVDNNDVEAVEPADTTVISDNSDETAE